MGAYTQLNIDPFAPAAQFRPRLRRSAPGGMDLLAPSNTDTQPDPTDDNTAPQVQAPQQQTQGPAQGQPDPFAPLYQNVRNANTALVDKANELGSQAPYQPRHRGTMSRVGEGLLSMFSPAAANAIFEKPEDREYQAHQATEQQHGKQLQALQYAAQNAEKELDLAERGPERKARLDWYNRRTPITDAKTINVKHNGQNHTHQMNPDTGRFDIEAGEPIDKTVRSTPFEEWRASNPDAPIADWLKLEHQYGAGRQDRAPTHDESMLNLFRKDPATYHQLYPDKGQNQSFDPRIMALAVASSKDELGEVDPEAAMDLYDKYSARIQARHQGGQGGQDLLAPGARAPIAQGPRPVASHAPTNGMPQVQAPGQPQGGGKRLTDRGKAGEYLRRAGGNKDQARKLAKADGYTF